MSIFHIVKKNYNKLPSWALNAMGTVYYAAPADIRYGKVFHDTRKKLLQTEYCTVAERDEIVNALFLQTVNHAYEHVPFYRNLYNEYGVDFHLIKSVEDIGNLPIIDKQVLRECGNEMLSDDTKKSDLIYITTSGSTGNPVGFYQSKSMMMAEWAYTMHIWSRIGCKPDSSRLVLRGKGIHPGAQDPNVFWDPLRRELSCNIFNMTPENMEKYCRAIEKHKPAFIHGYMSATVMLCKYIALRNGGIGHQFSGILATSENIVPEQKQFVEKVLNTRVFSFYGHSERLVIAGECEKSSAYHIEPLYGYAEVLDENKKSCTTGELVATGFLNQAMPLIRYRTGDTATWDSTSICPCGRKHLRLDGVQGRWHQDVLVNKEGAYVTMTALNIHTDDFDRIIRYQFVQTTPGVVDMLVMPLPTFTEENAARIRSLLTEKCFAKMQFNVTTVANIPLLKNGKFRIVEQKIPIEFQGDGRNI